MNEHHERRQAEMNHVLTLGLQPLILGCIPGAKTGSLA